MQISFWNKKYKEVWTEKKNRSGKNKGNKYFKKGSTALTHAQIQKRGDTILMFLQELIC